MVELVGIEPATLGVPSHAPGGSPRHPPAARALALPETQKKISVSILRASFTTGRDTHPEFSRRDARLGPLTNRPVTWLDSSAQTLLPPPPHAGRRIATPMNVRDSLAT